MGVDPDLLGGIAFIREDRTLVASARFDLTPAMSPGGAKNRINPKALRAAIEWAIEPGHHYIAFVEMPAMMQKGATAIASQFYTVGAVSALLSWYMPVIEVHPIRWKTRLGLKGKEAARNMAAQLHPGLFPKGKPRVKDTGMAEAALIAHYGLQVIEEQ